MTCSCQTDFVHSIAEPIVSLVQGSMGLRCWNVNFECRMTQLRCDVPNGSGVGVPGICSVRIVVYGLRRLSFRAASVGFQF